MAFQAFHKIFQISLLFLHLRSFSNLMRHFFYEKINQEYIDYLEQKSKPESPQLYLPSCVNERDWGRVTKPVIIHTRTWQFHQIIAIYRPVFSYANNCFVRL